MGRASGHVLVLKNTVRFEHARICHAYMHEIQVHT